MLRALRRSVTPGRQAGRRQPAGGAFRGTDAETARETGRLRRFFLRACTILVHHQMRHLTRCLIPGCLHQKMIDKLKS